MIGVIPFCEAEQHGPQGLYTQSSIIYTTNDIGIIVATKELNTMKLPICPECRGKIYGMFLGVGKDGEYDYCVSCGKEIHAIWVERIHCQKSRSEQ